MSLFTAYETDASLEKKGIHFTPDTSTCITLARAGGDNVKYGKTLAAKTKPYRRQIDAGTLDPEIDKRMMSEVYAEAVVKNWETLVLIEGKPQLTQGIVAHPERLGQYQGEAAVHQGADGEPLHVVPYNKHNVVATFMMLHDLLIDCQREASTHSNFQDEDREDDAKN